MVRPGSGNSGKRSREIDGLGLVAVCMPDVHLHVLDRIRLCVAESFGTLRGMRNRPFAYSGQDKLLARLRREP
jgi:hypothetical protein